MVSIRSTPLKRNRATGSYETTVTVRNNLPSTPQLTGPFYLLVKLTDPSAGALLNAEGVNSNDLPYVSLPVTQGMLSPRGKAVVKVQFSTSAPTLLTPQYFLEATPLTPANSATIEVRGYDVRELEDLSDISNAPPVSKGFGIWVDEVERGVTAAKAANRIQVPITATSVRLTLPPSLTGSAALTDLQAGETRVVNVPVSGDAEAALPATITIDELQQSIYPTVASTATVRLRHGGSAVVVKSVDEISLYDRESDIPTDIKGLFARKPNGSLVASRDAFGAALLGRVGNQRLVVRGFNARGQVFVGELNFSVGLYRSRGLVMAATGSGAPVANVGIKLSLLNGSLQIFGRSDASGNVTLPELPAGAFTASAQIEASGFTYSASGEISITSDSLITFTIGGFSDDLAGATGVATSLLPAPGAAAAPTETVSLFEPARIALHQQYLQDTASLAAQGIPALVVADGVSASATAGTENVAVTDVVQMTIPQGTSTIQLRYTVTSQEYPTYVLANSIYNDRWSVAVLANRGGSLFNLARQVNSQISQDPVWLPSGSTGEVTQQIDVAQLTMQGSVELGLKVTATNIGDSILPTSVTATLDLTSALSITKITPDTIAAANGHRYYSIPRVGAINDRQRYFTLNVSKSEDTKLERVKVELQGTSGLLMKTLDTSIPSGRDVQVVSQAATSAVLKVRGTFLEPASTVAADPPSTRNLVYAFTLEGSSNGQTVIATKSFAGRRSLWRMPSGLARFGSRDTGGDDWVAKGTYEWLVGNASVITRINDVSGEHGRYIGHNTHARGTDIDIYHFYTFPGISPSALGAGNLNYQALVKAVQLAAKADAPNPPAGAADAKANVTSWVTATRAGCDLITDRGEVATLIYAAGGAASGLNPGWAAELLTAGKTKVGKSEFNLGVGTWSANKMAFNQIHNDHLHITLDRSAIGEGD